MAGTLEQRISRIEARIQKNRLRTDKRLEELEQQVHALVKIVKMQSTALAQIKGIEL